MANWIIDDFGGINRSGSVETTRTLGYTTGGVYSENYAIENIGYIGIYEGKTSITVRCRPAMMSDKAISSLWYWLLDREKCDVVVAWLDEIWHVEHSMPCRIATTFLGYLLEKRSAKPSPAHNRLLSRQWTMPRSKWSENGRETVSLLESKSSDDARRHSLDEMYNGRWTLVELHLSSNQLSTIDHGGGYPPLHPSLIGERRDFSFYDVGDRLYREWILCNFIEIAKTKKPKFEDVDAIVSWPRIGDIRTRYWRAVLPVRSKRGYCSLLSVSGSDSSIDLRPDLVQVNG